MNCHLTHRKTPKYYLIFGRTASARYGALMASGHFGPCNIRSLRKKLLSEEFENSRLAPWAVTRDERFISHLASDVMSGKNGLKSILK